VLIWSEKSAGSWEQKLLHDFQGPVWRVSWSVTGSILAVTDSSNAVTLWKETLDGKWQQLSQ
jgi:protein transport protein SEC13